VPARELFELKYGKALVQAERLTGAVPVYGTNGRCGTHDKPLFAGPGIVIGRKGQGPLGVEWSDEPYWVIDTAYSLVPLRPNLDLKFFYYLVKYIGLNHLKDGTSNPTLSRDTFGAQALPLPPLDEQRRIARILGALDQRIELNRRMSGTLESIVRVIFKSWFVDFDPVHAKAEGGDGGPPVPIAALFPDSFVNSALGEIPRGWSIATLGESFEITMGQSPPGETYNGAGVGVPFYQGRRDFGDRYPARRVFCSEPMRLARADDTLVSVRAPVGDTNLATETCCVGRGLAAIRHRSGATNYTYEMLRSLGTALAAYEAGGTVFGAIAGRELASLAISEPPSPLVRAFEAMVAPLGLRLRRLDHESNALMASRDALLPRLLSGELRTHDVARAVTG
jgi:type I restriction enzyme S subunit